MDSAPGVVRQGDGWSSLSSGEAMAKPSSIASLRERALAFLRDDKDRDLHLRDARDSYSRDIHTRDSHSRDVRNSKVMADQAASASASASLGGSSGRQIVDLAQVVEDKRVSRGDMARRPGTPGGQSIFNHKDKGGNVNVDGKRGIFGRWKGKWGNKKDEA